MLPGKKYTPIAILRIVWRRRWLIEPMSLGRLIQMAVVDDKASVLDVGCASGYSSAVLSRLAKRVIALEDDPALAEFAMLQLRALGLNNVEVIVAAPAAGHEPLAPYDVILVNGRLRRVPDALVRQLAPAGRLVAAKSAAIGRTRFMRMLPSEAVVSKSSHSPVRAARVPPPVHERGKSLADRAPGRAGIPSG